MGWIKNAKANTVAADARQAIENDRTAFTPMLNTPAIKIGFSGAIDDWSVMIEAIEAQGWQMVHWAVTTDDKGRPQAYPLFRRR